MSPEQGAVGFIISLGRLTSYGAKIVWDKKGALLSMPGGKTVKLPMHNNCPHASPEIVRDFEALKARQYRRRQGEELLIKLATAHRAKLKSQQELDDHRRAGHPHYSPDCPECKKGAAKKRPHKRPQSKMGG